MKNSNHLNIDVAIKILVLLGFASFFLISIFTGSVSLYVHPRIIPYMIFAAAAMVVIALLLLQNLFKADGKSGKSWSLLFFAIPLIMAFTLPAQSFNSGTAAIGQIQLSGGVSDNTNGAAQAPEVSDNSAASSPAIDAGQTAEGEQPDKGIVLQNGVLVMDGSNFYETLCEIYADMSKYKGTPISVVGFVFKENDTFAENEFVPARLMMVCCAADMQPVGLLCQYENTSELEADSWVIVSGTIEETEFEGRTIPYIAAQSVEITQEPDDAYIYPY